MIYTDTLITRWHDTDAHRRVRPTAMLIYMQETSNKHMEACGMSLDALRDENGLAFLLSKIRMSVYRPLYAFEKIEVQTWTCPSHGLAIPRFYRILRDGEVIAEADSTWALLDMRDGRLLRADECDVFNFEDEEPLPLDVPSRFRLPKGMEPENVGKRKIVFSDLDYNMHMNNTRYPDMLCDFIPADDVDRIRGILLSYVNEAAFGDELEINRASSDNAYYFRTVSTRTGKTCLEAELILDTEERR